MCIPERAWAPVCRARQASRLRDHQAGRLPDRHRQSQRLTAGSVSLMSLRSWSLGTPWRNHSVYSQRCQSRTGRRAQLLPAGGAQESGRGTGAGMLAASLRIRGRCRHTLSSCCGCRGCPRTRRPLQTAPSAPRPSCASPARSPPASRPWSCASPARRARRGRRSGWRRRRCVLWLLLRAWRGARGRGRGSSSRRGRGGRAARTPAAASAGGPAGRRTS